MSTHMCVKELHGILGIASLLSLHVTKEASPWSALEQRLSGLRCLVRRPWIFFSKVAMVTAGSLPITREAAVNTITGWVLEVCLYVPFRRGPAGTVPGAVWSLPSVLRPRAADTPALVECGEVLWNVLKDIEDVQALLLALGCRLLLDGV